MLNILETQRKLIAAALPSGFESPQAALLAEMARPFVDEVFVDTLGNVICHKKGKGKKLMMPAHMDVIGFMSLFVDKDGFIRFTTIGGHVMGTLINTPIRFENGVKGCIRYDDKADVAKTSTMGIDKNKLYIDIGAKDYDEAAALVPVGSVAVFDADAVEIAGGNIMTPYADDLMACVVLLLTMEQMGDSPNDLYYVFTVQEERGLLGAKTAAYRIEPDMAVAVDLTRTGDTPGEEVKMEVYLGKGPAIKIKDSGTLANPQVIEHLRAAAKKAKIAYQNEILLSGSTDAALIQRVKGGIVTGTISIPGRHIHTPGETVNIKDVQQAAKLLATAAMMEI